MNRKIVLLSAIAASVAVASPAMAWGGWRPSKPSTSSSSGSSGGQSSTSSGGSHQVPEPGMLALMGAGLIGLGLARRRKARD